MIQRIRSKIAALNTIRGLPYLWHRLGNWRRGRIADLDYILLMLPVKMPALPEQRAWFLKRVLGNPPMNLSDLDRHFRQIGADPRLKGVVLHLRGFAMPLADLQTLRASILRLREKGKRVIAFAQGYDNATYYIASACDEILLQPRGMFNTLGLISQPTFLRSALETIGVQLDSVAITPFTSASIFAIESSRAFSVAMVAFPVWTRLVSYSVSVCSCSWQLRRASARFALILSSTR